MSPSFTVWLKSGWLGQRYRRLLGVGVPLVLLTLYLSALPLQAAGSDIRVLSDRQETEFPGDVVFNLAVEGEQELVEVRLYYRIAGSGAWTYSYATFQPGRRINASLNSQHRWRRLPAAGDRLGILLLYPRRHRQRA